MKNKEKERLSQNDLRALYVIDSPLLESDYPTLHP